MHRFTNSWWVVAAAVLGVLVVGAASVSLAPTGTRFAIWWPAAGLAAALVALSRPARWPALAALLFVAATGANAWGGRDLAPSLGFGVAGTVEALAFALLVGAHRVVPRLRTLADVVRFFGAVVGSAGIGAVVVACTVTLLLDGDVLVTWRTITASHGAAMLLVVPVALVLASPESGSRRSRAGVGEALTQVAATAAVVAAVFWPGQSYALEDLVIPFLVWAGARLAPLWVSCELLAVGVSVTVLTRVGGGPFAEDQASSPEVAGALAQAFLAVCVIAVLPLSISMAQRARALVEAVATRNDFEAERDLLSAVLDGCASMVLVVDASGVVRRANAAASDLTGRPLDEIVGRPLTALLAADERAGAADDLLAPGRSAVVHELAVATVSGRTCRVIATAGALDGGAAGRDTVVVGLDVTEQRAAERLLEAVLGATLATSIIGTDTGGVINFVNVGAERLLGRPREQLIGRSVLEQVHLTDEVVARAAAAGHASAADALTGQAVLSGAGERDDWTYVRADGSELTVSLVVTAMRDDRGALQGFLGVAEDVTDRRRDEEQVRRALEQEREAVTALRAVDVMKTQFISTTSHELRTPLTSVLGFTQLLASDSVGPLNDAQSDLLGRIERSGLRLLTLVENILTLSRIEGDELELARDPVDVRAAVASACDAVLDPARPQPLDVRLHLPDAAAGEIVVLGDRDHLERAVINVLTNALKFTPDGGRVELTLVADGRQVVVEVTDTGIGIPLDEQRSLFTRFFRGSNATALAIQGTGLGLSIVRSVVEEHGGSIAVESAPGAGTTITLVFPRFG